MVQGHHPEVRKVSFIHPHALGFVGLNSEDSSSLDFSDTSTCWKESLFVKVSLRGRDIAVIEGYSLLPLRKNSGKLGIMFRIGHFDFHHLHFVPAPELSLFSPLIPYGEPFSLERAKQGKKIFPTALRIESRSKRIFKSMKQPIFAFDQKNHRGVEWVEVEEPSPEFHRFTQLLIGSEMALR